MRKYLTGIIVLVILTLLNVINNDHVVNAAVHKLEDLHIHVSIEEDGHAKIIETRKVDLSEGTENYIVIENLGKSTIRDFTVTENGEVYEFIENWNIDASREEKTFKNGLITTNNGYELSWGIGDYGKHEYVVEYVITDFIKQLKDAQILFWRFVNDQTNIPPENVTVEIETDKQLSDEEERIWAFGFPGDIHFTDGKVTATSSEPLKKSDYVTILVQFTDDIFSTEDHIDQTFEEVQDLAFEGSDYGKEDEQSSGSSSIFGSIFNFIKSSISVIFFGILLFLFLKIGPQLGSGSASRNRRKFRRKYKEEYYRDYPYEGYFLDAYHVVYSMGLSNFKTMFTAVLLKWIKEDRIMVETSEGGMFRKSRATLTILNDDMEMDSTEEKLFNLLKNAAGSKKVLNENQLTKWAERHRNRLYSWEKEVMNNSARTLRHEGYVTTEEKKVLFMKRKVHELTQSGEDMEENTYKYVNYLYDFSLLNEHEAVNVKIWDEIMIWAAFLGLTEVVMKQFKSLYPQYVEETIYRDNTIFVTSTLANSASKGRATRPSRSSGGGGTASRGGGGGSFGGGSGGGTR